jgi:ribosome-associated toxin RatA of RatAB toxin-antitoxin module
MREVRRSAIVPYSPQAMFALVADVAAYPQFVPGCTAARVITSSDAEVVASLALRRGVFDASFTTRNTLEPPHRLVMQLVDGPFSALEGEWAITPLGAEGSRVELTVRFAMRSGVRSWLLGSAFEQTCSGLVDAFVQRARAVYDGGAAAGA